MFFLEYFEMIDLVKVKVHQDRKQLDGAELCMVWYDGQQIMR